MEPYHPCFVNYLKDVSALLAMIRSVTEYNIEMHLEAEKALLLQLLHLVIQITVVI